LNAASKIIAAVLTVASLAGCTLEPPEIASGRVSVSEVGRPIQELSLNDPSQLNAWLKGHREGWSRSVTTYVPRINAQLQAKDGTGWGINIVDRLVVVNGAGAQFTQSFQASEIESLKAAMGIRQ